MTLLGDYRTRCLFSKTWALREASVFKTRLLLQTEFANTIGIANCLAALSGIVQVAAEDKITQVFSIALFLLDDILSYIAK